MSTEPFLIAGPSALGGSKRRFLYLAFTLAATEFKLRFFGSALGYLWQLVRPLLLFGVLYVVFTEFVKVGGPVPFYPVVLLANIVLFTFLQEGTGAVASVVNQEALVRKIHFPRMAIPVAVVLTAGFNLTLNLGVVIVFGVASGIHPRWSWLQAPALIALLATLVIGLAMLLSALYVRYRDVKPIWEVALQVLFYATPVIYAIETISVSPRIKELLMLNPIAAILEQFRHAVIDPGAPSAAVAAGGGHRLLVPVALLFVTVAAGYYVFDRTAPRIAEELCCGVALSSM
jgi:ABC-2 type transport system permease protein